MGNTQYEKNLRAVATACKNYVDETKEQILWQVGQYDITTQDDNTTAYQKIVPTGATRVKIKSIGFVSYKCNQLFDNANTELIGKTFSGANQTVYSYYGFAMKVFNLTIGQTYTISTTKNIYIGQTDDVNNSGTTRQVGGGSSYTFTATTNYLLITNKFANQYEEMFNNLMLNKGSTALPYQPYFTGLRDSVVTSIVSKDANNNVIDTITIPSEIQALEGYGQGINDTCYNYIDFENKKFIQKVARVDLGTLTYNHFEVSNLGHLFRASIPTMAYNNTTDLLCANYNTVLSLNRTNGTIYKTQAGSAQIDIIDNSYTDANTFKTAMNGVLLYFDLATPVETAITEQAPLLEVEEGGYLVFENQYQQAVPSNITYRIEVAR